MADPLTFAEDLRSAVKLYMGTAFGTRYDHVNSALALLIDQEGVFQREPFIEVMPRYATGRTLDNLATEALPGLSLSQTRLFTEFARCGLFDDRFSLYK